MYDYENDVIRPLGDPRIHFALNCMVKACPRLPQEPFRAENLDETLNALAREFVNDPRHVQVVEASHKVRLSEILSFYSIASILLFSGLGKLLDVPGFVQVLTTYQAIPAWGLHMVAITLVLVELRIAEWLFRDKTLVIGAFGSLVLHAVFTLWTVVTLLRGVPVPNCGCFGVFFARPLTGWTVVEDLVLVIASLYLFITMGYRETRSSSVLKNQLIQGDRLK